MANREDLFRNLNEKNFNPMNDVIFKFIFGKEERKNITIDFLNALLADDLGHRIINIEFAPTEMSPETEGIKLTRLDVACTLDTQEKVDVEVQVVNHQDMQRRTLYYWAQMYLMGLMTGHDYIELKPVITVNILRFNLFDNDRPYSIWSVCDLHSGERLNKDLTLHFLEIPKFATIANKPIAQMTPMERWLAYFANKLDNRRKEELVMSEAAINDAINAARTFFHSDAERRQYIAREMAIMDYNADINGAKEEGRREGLTKGRSEGSKQMLKLVQAMLKDGRAADVAKLSEDPALLQELMAKYHIQ